MPPKRKIKTLNKDSPPAESSPYIKRSRRSTNNLDQSDLVQSIFEVIKDYQDENEHFVAESFNKLPSKRLNPEYYEEIVDPVDLTKIGLRIRMDEYRDIENFTTDIQLMISNAKKFYPEDSQEYKDGCSLWEMFLATKAHVLEEASQDPPTQPKETPTRGRPGRKPKIKPKESFDNETLDQEQMDLTMEDMKEVYESVVTETDDTGRVIAEMFMQVPDQSNEQYYEVIENPIDFLIIGDRIENDFYRSSSALKKDVNLLVKNAKTFNEPSSQIYNDAVTIKSMFYERIHEFEKSKHSHSSEVKTSARIKIRKSWGRASNRLHEKLSVKEREDSDMHVASITHCKSKQTQVAFYNEIVNHRVNDHYVADPFVRLPNKRHYPMYYEEIQNPISLKLMRKKIVSKKYETCEEIVPDFDLLATNAMTFNISSSQIHRDAVILQKLVHSRIQYYAEKEKMEEESSEEEEEEEETEDREETMEEEVAEPKRVYRKKLKTATLKDRLKNLHQVLMTAVDAEGREMINLFLEKPSRKDYPEYYKLVLEPIDMKMIVKKIKQEKYMSVKDLVDDFKLMFNNARHFNEPTSEVYADADRLEKIMEEKFEELSLLPPVSPQKHHDSKGHGISSKKLNDLSFENKLDRLLVSVRDFIDPTNRTICDIFTHLPTRAELPDYYTVIKRPMEMDRIQQKKQSGFYVKLDEMLADMLLMFENACVYNEPGSQVYKDALILQKVALESYQILDKLETLTPMCDVVHEMLVTLFLSVLEHQDETGRCYSESLTINEITGNENDENQTPMETDSVNNKMNMGVVKNNLRNKRYRRLDVFQAHMFEIFEEVRMKNSVDSEAYEDAVELQKQFVRIRDELCKNGEMLMSPALSFTAKRLENEVDTEKKERMHEIKEDVENNTENKEDVAKFAGLDFKGSVYNVGDFVYVENLENSTEPPHIVCIEKLYTDEKGEQRLYGVWFFRPEATFHIPSKKFYVKEVFKSDYYNTVPINLIKGRCYVMLGKDYFKNKPIGVSEDDVFVCVARYSSKDKSFKKIKFLNLPPNSIQVVSRSSPLPVIRISSCFSDNASGEEGIQRTLLNTALDSWPNDVIDKDRENITTDQNDATYYTQLYTQNMWLKLGDCVYVKRENKIARIEKMWVDGNSNVWFHGPWFVRPVNVQHEPTRIFYKNELFLSSVEDTVPMSEISGKCVVLSAKDYFACRPTEIFEKDVYLFESKYYENEKMTRKLKGVKRYVPMHKVVDDEYYYPKKQFPVINVLSPILLSLVGREMVERQKDAEDQKKKAVIPVNPVPQQPAIGYVPQPHHMYPGQPVYDPQSHVPQPYQHAHYPLSPAHAGSAPAQYMHGAYPRYPVPGQPMYQSHMYPGSPHHGMTPSPGLQSPDGSRPSSVRPDAVATPPVKKKGRSGHSTGYILFASECHPKVRAENPEMIFGEISKIVGEEWRNLEDEKKKEFEEKAREQTARLEAEGKLIPKKKKKKKDAEDTPQMMQPQQAMYPGHQYGTPGHVQQSNTPQPQPTPSTGPYPAYTMPTSSAYMQTPSGPTVQQPQPQAAITVAQQHRLKRGPLFVKPPPKPQRVLHSEAYLNYIEGLERGTKNNTNWQQTLNAREENVQLTAEAERRLPVHWLGNAQGRHKSTKAALWSLRDHMLKDALSFKNNLY